VNTGDLEPDWIVDITASSGTDFSLVESWKFHAYRETTEGKVEAFTEAGAAAEPGVTANVVSVRHVWVAGETDVPGVLHGVPIAVWPDGREQSFPGATLEIGTDASD
jgi:hypothetical protein